MSDRHPPHDLAAERAVLGAMMLDPAAIVEVRATLDAGDFYAPNHAAIFDAIGSAYDEGATLDAVVVADYLRRTGELDRAGGIPALSDIMATTPMTSAVHSYAAIVGRLGHLRRLLGALTDGVEKAWDPGTDPESLTEAVATSIESLASPRRGLPADADSFDAWLESDHADPPWVIPGMLRLGWRAVIVAAEGSGKSVIGRQMALCAAQGLHPFALRPMPPINTLMVDLENPNEAIAETGRATADYLRTYLGARYREHACWLWHRPSGIDLRARRDRAEFDAMCAHVRPQLVVLGPLYRTFTKKGREDHEEAAEQVQRVLDDLRVRHGFALLIEHHAPKGTGRHRDMVPFGSSLWQRWPDLGLTAVADDDRRGSLRLGRYRGDRVRNYWPERLDRGGALPWTGYYAAGLPDERGEEPKAF